MVAFVVGHMLWKSKFVWVLGFLLFFVLQTLAEETPLPEETPFPVVTKKTVIRGFEEGRLVWLLKAEEIQFDKGGNKAFASSGIELEVYDAEGKIRSTLKADAAEIDLLTKTFFFTGSVEVVSQDGERIVTNELVYRDRVKIVETKSFTRVFFDHNYIECTRLYSDIDFHQPEFYGILKGSFRLES